MLFQLRKVVEDAENDGPCLRAQTHFPFGIVVALGMELPTYAVMSMLCYTHVISCDGRFFALFTCEIPHITYRKFNTGISNELASQRERTIVSRLFSWHSYLRRRRYGDARVTAG